MFIAALFTIAKKGKQWVSIIEEQINKMLFIYTIKYYMAIKENQTLYFVAGMELEDIVFSAVL